MGRAEFEGILKRYSESRTKEDLQPVNFIKNMDTCWASFERDQKIAGRELGADYLFSQIKRAEDGILEAMKDQHKALQALSENDVSNGKQMVN